MANSDTRPSVTPREVLALADRLTTRSREVRAEAPTTDIPSRLSSLVESETLIVLGQNLRDGVVLNLVTDFDDFVTRCARNFEMLGTHWKDQERKGGRDTEPLRAAALARAYGFAVRTIRERIAT